MRRIALTLIPAAVALALVAGCTTLSRGTCVGHLHYCRFIDEASSEADARLVANRALSRCRVPSIDYHNGFEQAYVDIAQGATGTLPPVPPKHYWKACMRTPGGHQAAQHWYAGYAAGAQSAGARSYPLDVPTSGSYYDGGMKRYPDFDGGPVSPCGCMSSCGCECEYECGCGY